MNKKDLIIQLVKTSFKLRYNNSFLGLIWVFLKPFINFLVQYFVWTTIFQNTEEFYAVKLMLGIILWTFLNEGMIFGMNGLLEKAGVILKINFPRYTAIIASTLMAVVNFVINILLFFIIFGIYNFTRNGVIISNFSFAGFGIAVTGVLLSLIAFYVICLGVSYFLSIIVVRFRDLQNILELFFSITMWLTPVVISKSFLIAGHPDNVNSLYYKILDKNPVGWIIDFARNAVIYGKLDGYQNVLAVIFFSLILVYVGSIYFSKRVKYVAEYF